MVIVQLHGSQSTARLLTAFAAPLLPPVTRSGTTRATTLVKSAVALLATDGGATRRPPLAAQPLVRHQDALSLNQVLDMHTQQKASQTSSAVSKMERAIFRDDIGGIVCGLFDCANAIVLASYYSGPAISFELLKLSFHSYHPRICISCSMSYSKSVIYAFIRQTCTQGIFS